MGDSITIHSQRSKHHTASQTLSQVMKRTSKGSGAHSKYAKVQGISPTCSKAREGLSRPNGKKYQHGQCFVASCACDCHRRNG